jgi:peptidoglycan/xylan/chitin deacetylase (PgdA/CDA1 family)
VNSRPQRIKDWTKHLSKKMILSVGRLGLKKSSGRILTYHSVGSRNHEMNVTPLCFKEQMQWLCEQKIPVRPVHEILDGAEGIALTFDDGYVDNLTEAVPILKEYGYPATIYVVAGKIGENLQHDPATEENRLMDAEELVLLDKEGIEIGAHTLTHCRLSKLSPEEQRKEIVESTVVLRELLGKPITGFAYPYGSILDFNDVSEKYVKESGCSYAVSNRYGPVESNSNRWAARRIWIDRSDTLEIFQLKVLGKLDGLWVLDSRICMAGRRLFNAVLGT